jgi:nitrogen regulatory protein PII 1
MNMIRSILRPESVDKVTDALAESGFYSLTKINVFGRGMQKGITVRTIHYDKLAKVMLLMVANNKDVEDALKIIKFKTYIGNFGDDKVFICPIENAVRVRTDEIGKKAIM